MPATSSPRAPSGTVRDDANWGGYPRVAQQVVPLWWTGDPLPWSATGGVLAHGAGRSYGDSALAAGDTLVDLTPCRRLRSFDPVAGVVTAEAGITLGELAEVVLPHGWMVPVMPGTRHVTLGGAIANDIHGKNHFHAGAFGCHVRQFELRRSDRATVLTVTPSDELFGATIGGLGLTGVIVAATIALLRVPGPGMRVRVKRFRSWDEYYALAESTTEQCEYSVGWFAPGDGAQVRGIFRMGDASAGPRAWCSPPPAWASMPPMPPFAVGRASIAAFNRAYFVAGRYAEGAGRTRSLWPFHHPLDGVRHVNNIYGRRGFIQYHLLVPEGADRQVVPDIVARITGEGLRVFLPVVKRFGPRASPGWLSFPQAGTSVALDLPWQGERMFAVLDALDARLADCGGRVYPAKDARMSAPVFRRFYPRWEELARHRDPGLASRFWQRVAA